MRARGCAPGSLGLSPVPWKHKVRGPCPSPLVLRKLRVRDPGPSPEELEMMKGGPIPDSLVGGVWEGHLVLSVFETQGSI